MKNSSLSIYEIKTYSKPLFIKFIEIHLIVIHFIYIFFQCYANITNNKEILLIFSIIILKVEKIFLPLINTFNFNKKDNNTIFYRWNLTCFRFLKTSLIIIIKINSDFEANYIKIFIKQWCKNILSTTFFIFYQRLFLNFFIYNITSFYSFLFLFSSTNTLKIIPFLSQFFFKNISILHLF